MTRDAGCTREVCDVASMATGSDRGLDRVFRRIWVWWWRESNADANSDAHGDTKPHRDAHFAPYSYRDTHSNGDTHLNASEPSGSRFVGHAGAG